MTKIPWTAPVGLMMVTLFGCASSTPQTQSLTEQQKQDVILADPMGYKPEVGRDITGGDITHVGTGLDKDVNDALNP